MRKLALGVLAVSLGTAFWADHGKAQDKAPAISASVKEIAPFQYVGRPCTGPYTKFVEEEKAFLADFKKLGIETVGVEFTIYLNSPFYVKPEALKWTIGFPVAGTQKMVGNLICKKFKYPKVACAVHTGSYLTTYKTINALYDWIAIQKMKTVGGPCVERYLDPDPTKVPDEKKQTEIWIPIQ